MDMLRCFHTQKKGESYPKFLSLFSPWLKVNITALYSINYIHMMEKNGSAHSLVRKEQAKLLVRRWHCHNSSWMLHMVIIYLSLFIYVDWIDDSYQIYFH